jgi:lipopolysaccharide export system permease protein
MGAAPARMRKLDLYIARNFLVTFFFMLLLITIIIVVFDVAEKIDDFTEKQLSVQVIITDYYASLLPFLLNRLAPVLVFLTVVFFTAQLSQRTEIVAMLASGISFYRILLPYLVVSYLNHQFHCTFWLVVDH